MTGWVTGGVLTLLDTYAPDSTNGVRPSYDTEQNLEGISGSTSGGTTTITFTRRANTGDASQDVVISNTTAMNILWAYCSSAGSGSGAGATYQEHTQDGTDLINFNPSGGTPTPGNGTNDTFSSPAGDFTLTWSLSADLSSITFTMTALTTGWLSFGISTTGQPSPHDNAQMYVAWVSGGTTTLLDTTGNSPSSQPEYNAVQTPTLISGHQAGGSTTVVFSRPVTVSAGVNIQNSDLYLLWAYATAAGTGTGASATYQQHSSAGSGTVNFLSGGSTTQPSTESGLDPAEILIISVLVLFLLKVVFRFTRRYIKYRKAKKALASGDLELTGSGALGEDIKVEAVQQRTVRSTSIRPLTSYYQESTKVTRRSGKKGDVEKQPLESMDSQDTEGGIERSSSSTDQIGSRRSPAPLVHQESAVQMPAQIIGAKSSGNRVTNFIRAFLLYRVPHTHVSVGSILVGLIFLALNIIALVRGVGDDWGRKLGSLSAANSLLVAIPATRNSILIFLLGIAFDRVIMYHRWMGVFTVLVNCLHFLLELIQWWTAKVNSTEQTFYVLPNMYGFLAWVICLGLFFSSLQWIRRNRFEWFFYLHFLFIPYYVFGALHAPKFIPYMIAAVVFYGLDRVIRLFWGFWPVKAFLRIKGKQYNDKEYSIIQVSFPKNTLADFTGAYKTGQYVFANFPQISLLEWHPFSISSGPDEITLELHIRSLGDHTKLIQEKAEKSAVIWIRVDGPYGNLGLKLRRFPNIVLASGGIGMSPVIGIVKDLYRCGKLDSRKVQRPSHVMEDVRVLWVARSPGQYSWFEEEMAKFFQAAQSQDLPRFHADIFITGTKENDPAFQALAPISDGKASLTFHVGRPDFNQFCTDAISMDKANLIFVCGPAQMVTSLWDASVVYSTKGASVRFHHEVFEF